PSGMKLYLDEGTIDAALIGLLRRDGHDVETTDEVGMRGESDPVQLVHAITEQRVLLTHNHDDFEDLHDLVIISGGHHLGILIVRRDTDPTRDLSARGIVRAIANLVASGFVMADQCQILNHWR